MRLENRRGERNGMAKLTARKVVAIRRKAAAGAKLKSLASEYGVSHVAIHFVVTRKTWRHVP